MCCVTARCQSYWYCATGEVESQNREVSAFLDSSIISCVVFCFFPSQPTAPLVYPSLLAHAAMDELLHPSIALLAPHPPSSSPSYNPLQQPFPCEVYLVRACSLSLSLTSLMLQCMLRSHTYSRASPLRSFFFSVGRSTSAVF